MSRPLTISSGQRWDVPLETPCAKMAEVGYDRPLSVEWEGPQIEGEQGAREALAIVSELDVIRSQQFQEQES